MFKYVRSYAFNQNSGVILSVITKNSVHNPPPFSAALTRPGLIKEESGGQVRSSPVTKHRRGRLLRWLAFFPGIYLNDIIPRSLV